MALRGSTGNSGGSLSSITEASEEMATNHLAAEKSGAAPGESTMDRRGFQAVVTSRFDFVLVAAAMAVILGLIVLSQQLFGGRPSLVLLTPPIVIAAARGGWRLGWAATLMAVPIAIFASLVGTGFGGAAMLEVAVILGGGGLCAWYGDRLLRSRADSAAKTVALAVERSQLQSILNTSPDAILAIDEKGVLVSFNRAAEQIFGCLSSAPMGLIG